MNALFTCHSPNSVPQGLAVLAAAALLLGAGNMSVVMAENAYAGRYMGDGLVAEIKAGASGFTGTLKMGTQAFPLTASEVAGCLAGRFKSGEDEFKFEAVLQSDKLTLTTEGTTYTLVRKSIGSGASNPLAKPPPANPLARRAAESSDRGTGSKGPEVTQTSTPPEGEPGHGAAWKEFRHPTGFRMSYPPDWKLKELPAAVQLVPPDPASNADGPTEAYLVVAEAAEGVSAPSDPRVLAFLDGQMGKLVPFMRRSGSGTPVNAGSAPGVLVTWTGSNPKGMALQAHAFTTILKGYGVVLFAIGEKEQVAKRDKTLQGVFASFAAGEGGKGSTTRRCLEVLVLQQQFDRLLLDRAIPFAGPAGRRHLRLVLAHGHQRQPEQQGFIGQPDLDGGGSRHRRECGQRHMVRRGRQTVCDVAGRQPQRVGICDNRRAREPPALPER